MTTLMVVDGDRGETRSQAAARRLRGELAQMRISVSEVSRRLGVTQASLSRRMTGDVAFDVDLLDRICEVTGVSFVYVTSGIRETPGPDGPGGSEVRHQGLEPRTRWFGVQPVVDLAERRPRRVVTPPATEPLAVPA